MSNEIMVAGLLFSPDAGRVALVRKNRPMWQRGRLNGIGGHMELNELGYEAMQREFAEEAGVEINNWRPFCIMYGKDFTVHWFTAFKEVALRTMTDEPIAWYSVEDVLRMDSALCAGVIPNVRWLILMALDDENLRADVEYVDPEEDGR